MLHNIHAVTEVISLGLQTYNILCKENEEFH